MIISVKTCPACGSSNLIRFGKNCAGTPRCRCKDCGACRVLEPKRPELTPERQELVAKAYQGRNSSRSTGRIFGVSHVTVQDWLKKARFPSPFKEIVQPAKPEGTLEVDEVSAFINLKINQVQGGGRNLSCRKAEQHHSPILSQPKFTTTDNYHHPFLKHIDAV